MLDNLAVHLERRIETLLALKKASENLGAVLDSSKHHNDLINTPDASRLIFGLRDTGYDFPMAVADIVDNSIAANATEVSVDVELKSDGRKFVYFADNGHGMDYPALKDAMKYGAKERENLASLGKFGLGLKTASSSVCRAFTLISRKSPADQLRKLTWDLDHVERTGQWEMLQDDVTSDESSRFDEYCGDHGTLLIWSRCDRLLKKHYDAGSSGEKQAVNRLSKALSAHLGLVYYRFLDASDDRSETVKLFVNGTELEGWNPFFPERAEQVIGSEHESVDVEISTGEVSSAHVRAWILPHKDDCDEKERDQANIQNKRQGFYVFRENRLIHEGGWLGIDGWGSMEPHLSLLRVEFDFDHVLDEAFMVDVKKSRIILDPVLESYLKALLTPIRREADQRYRKKQKKSIISKNIDHTGSNKTVSQTPNTRKADIVEVDPATSSATVNNSSGDKIRLKLPSKPNVNPENLYVEASKEMMGAELWEPVLRSSEDAGFKTGVAININHDFYQKIYLRAKNNGYSVQGMDLLLWALSAAEVNYSDEKMQRVFEDLREEVSSNLKKLLRDVELPDDADLADGES